MVVGLDFQKAGSEMTCRTVQQDVKEEAMKPQKFDAKLDNNRDVLGRAGVWMACFAVRVAPRHAIHF